MNKKIKIAFTGGGTGGHTSAAQAIIEHLKTYLPEKHSMEIDPYFIGSHKGLERKMANELSIPYKAISTGKLRRYISFQNFTDIFRTSRGFFQSLLALRKIKPDLLLSTGSYVSVPVVLAARMLKIPIIVHEQTIKAGLANKIAAKYANKILVSFSEGMKYFPKSKTKLAGTPIRPSLMKGNIEDLLGYFDINTKLPLLYITGGSQGARIINKNIIKIIDKLLDFTNVIHQCGSAEIQEDYDTLKDLEVKLTNKNGKYFVREFLKEELPHVYHSANLLLGRSGAATVNEVIAFGIPAIFIPLKIAAEGEQLANAKACKEVNKTEIIQEDELSPEKLFDYIKNSLDDSEIDNNNTKTANVNLSQPIEIIAETILEILNND